MPVGSSTIFLVMVGIVGLLVGLLIGYLFADREPKKSKGDGIPADLAKDGFSDVARLLYSPSKKRIITGMDGGFFHEVKELTPDQRNRLSKVIRIWTDWSNKPVEETPIAVAEAPMSQENPVTSQGEPFKSAPESPADSSPFSTAAETVIPVEPFTGTRPEVDLGMQEPPAAPELAPEPLAPMVENQTIVDQINTVLQEKLAGTPYERRGLTLQDNLQNGVIVYVGGEKYDGIEAVPYADAQEMIHEAVADWERRFAPGPNTPA